MVQEVGRYPNQLPYTVGWYRQFANKTVYRSCIALFYQKRLPQQQGDRRIGERETSMH
jgi:hypothetical protein